MAESLEFQNTTKSLADFLPQEQALPPKPTERKQYSYCNTDEKTLEIMNRIDKTLANRKSRVNSPPPDRSQSVESAKSSRFVPKPPPERSLSAGPAISSKPPDPPDPKKEANMAKMKKLLEEKEHLKKALNATREILFQEYTNTNKDEVRVKKFTEIVKHIDRKWRPLYQELYNLYNILNIEDLFTQLKLLNREHKEVQNMIETVLELNGEGNQEENIPQSPLMSPKIRGALSIDSMLTGIELDEDDDDDNKSVVVKPKKIIIPTFKQKTPSILKPPTALTKLQQFKSDYNSNEKLVIQKIKAARYDINNCESIDETSHFEEVLDDIYDNVETCQIISNELANLHLTMNDENQATEQTKVYKQLRNLARKLEIEVFSTLEKFKNPEDNSYSQYSNISNGKFDELHGQDVSYKHVQDPKFKQYTTRGQDEAFLNKIFDDAQEHEQHQIRQKAMQAKMEMENPTMHNRGPYNEKNHVPAAANRVRSRFHGGGVTGQRPANHEEEQRRQPNQDFHQGYQNNYQGGGHGRGQSGHGYGQSGHGCGQGGYECGQDHGYGYRPARG